VCTPGGRTSGVIYHVELVGVRSKARDLAPSGLVEGIVKVDLCPTSVALNNTWNDCEVEQHRSETTNVPRQSTVESPFDHGRRVQ
jgi:hypothetical protein